VVPEHLAPDFKKLNLIGDSPEDEWARKVDQYVLGIKEEMIWGRTLRIQ
jgi:hypothetical protein